MLVENHMTKEPITIEPDELLIRASHKMRSGGFRRLPVVSDGKLVGIISERDLREHRGHLEHTKVNGVMTEKPVTVGPGVTVEEAARIMVEEQIGGLPVVEGGHLVGVISVTDVMNAFLDMMGASKGGSTRIDFVVEGEEHGFNEASRVIAREGGEVLGIGTYRDKLGDNPICYLRLISGDADKIAQALRDSGYDVLGVHRIGGGAK
ncbi:MAG TPA: CBS domain-containing protein [Candidatus Binatia bacterium]|jgi:acetoin utilization protein AcuB|nr:CBS domain-containing protein [Candidatus Binatia bacterium]